jgi:hypothetical protein
MPTATGDIREIVGQPVFVPLFKLYQVRGPLCMALPVTQLEVIVLTLERLTMKRGGHQH